MHVASLELCKELYELSGWKDGIASWHIEMVGSGRKYIRDSRAVPVAPQYDLGCLLRKLPNKQVKLRNGIHGWMIQWRKSGAETRNIEHVFEAATPEDAACKLAIELIRQGVLTGMVATSSVTNTDSSNPPTGYKLKEKD